MNETIQTPAPLGAVHEARALVELLRLLIRVPDLARQPRGRGQPVLVLPGYHCGDRSTALLQGYLRFLGYRVRGWGLGTNSAYRLEHLPRVLQRIGSFARHSGQGVRLIGWSLGGFLAREAARERPDWVRQVITLGTPVVGGPKYTIAAHRFFRRGIDLDAIEAEIAERNQILLRTPVTAIYSRDDAIVAWQACIDRHTPNVEHFEVRTSHYGFGFSPDVYKLIAKKLLKDDLPSKLTADRRHETKARQ